MTRPASAQIERLRALGYQPESIPLPLAAAFVGRTEGEFLRLVTAGIYPPPLPDQGSPALWCVAALRLAVRRMADLLPSDGPPANLDHLIEGGIDEIHREVRRKAHK